MKIKQNLKQKIKHFENLKTYSEPFKEWVANHYSKKELIKIAEKGMNMKNGITDNDELTLLYDKYNKEIWELIQGYALADEYTVLGYIDMMCEGCVVDDITMQTYIIWIGIELIAREYTNA